MAKNKIGALVVIKGKDLIQRHVDGGIELSGKISAPLILSLFDPNSPGHDGAVVMDNDRIETFACHLPLSRNHSEVGQGGTRHSAALGMSEKCDALCIVVSEERGTISAAQYGRLRVLSNADELTRALDNHYSRLNPLRRQRPLKDYLKKNYREKIIAILLSLGLWFVSVHSSKIVYRTYSIPVAHVELSKEWNIKDMNPKLVDVKFHAARSAFYFFKKDNIRLLVKLNPIEGDQRVRLYTENLTYPKDFILDHFDPYYIDVQIQKRPEFKPQEKPSS
jgi:hypothetical protein